MAEILTFHNSELVLSWSNVIETVTFREPNIRETRRRLELLEQIPQCYILGLPPLIRTEIRNAFRAFTLNSAAVAIDPFVPTWQRTLQDPGPALPADLLINYTTTKQVIDVVFNNPQLRQNENAEHVHYQHEVAADRGHNPNMRHSALWFRAAIWQTVVNSGLRIDRLTFERFADWMSANPTSCPGWLLFQESYESFCDNVTDAGQQGDSPDFSHIITAPYIDAITLDRRIFALRHLRSGLLSLQSIFAAQRGRECQNRER
ncbi:MAG TPA: hypothetical protein VN476_17140 [Pyrinomonadaceae bacterium]|nr:hypothetical protein [Pyrinomonadaceae bacterium]